MFFINTLLRRELNPVLLRDSFPAVSETGWHPDHILLDPGVISATIIGNEFSAPLRIINKSEGKVAIANSVDDIPSQ